MYCNFFGYHQLFWSIPLSLHVRTKDCLTPCTILYKILDQFSKEQWTMSNGVKSQKTKNMLLTEYMPLMIIPQDHKVEPIEITFFRSFFYSYYWYSKLILYSWLQGTKKSIYFLLFFILFIIQSRMVVKQLWKQKWMPT